MWKYENIDQTSDGSHVLSYTNTIIALKQQKLRSWRPVRSNICIIGLLFCFGWIMAFFSFYVNSVNENIVEYSLSYHGESPLIIPILDQMSAPIHVYYKLSGFYQNHHIYAQSRSDAQLHGGNPDTSLQCHPLSSFQGKHLYPCGLIVNSKFNDTFSAEICNDGSSGCSSIPIITQGITWDNDVSDKYHTRDLKPDETDVGPNGYIGKPTDEDLIVWLRIAAMSSFKKLYGRIQVDLKPGDQLKLSVNDNFPATDFEKSIVIATSGPLGGKQSFLFFVCVIMSCLFFISSFLFIFYECTYNTENQKQKFFHSHTVQSETNNTDD